MEPWQPDDMRVRYDQVWLDQVGDRLNEARKALQLDHADMARAAGISLQRWSNYTNKHRPLSVDIAIALCNRYGLTLDWIYRGRPEGLPLALAERLAPKPPPHVIPIQKGKKGR